MQSDYYRIFSHFLSSLTNNFKRNNSQNIPIQIDNFESQQNQWLYIKETFHMSQMNPK